MTFPPPMPLAPSSLAQNTRQRGPVPPPPLHLMFWCEADCLNHSHPLSCIKTRDRDTSTPPSGILIWGGCLNHPCPLPCSKCEMETLAPLHLAFQYEQVVSTTLVPSLTFKCKTEGPVPTSTPPSGISMQGRVVLTTLTLSLTQNARQRH